MLAGEPARGLAEGRAVVHAVGRQHAGGDDAQAVRVEHAGALLEAEAEPLLGAEGARGADLEEADRLRAGVGRRDRVAEDLVDREAQRLAPAEAAVGEEHGAVAGGGAGAQARLDLDVDGEPGAPGHAEHERSERGPARVGDGGHGAPLLAVRQGVEQRARDARERDLALGEIDLRAARAEAPRGERSDAARVAERLDHRELELELLEAVVVERLDRLAAHLRASAVEHPPDLRLHAAALEPPRGHRSPIALELVDQAGALLGRVVRGERGEEPRDVRHPLHERVHFSERTGDRGRGRRGHRTRET